MVFFITLSHELKVFRRNFSRILSVFLFFVITFFTFHLVASGSPQQGLDPFQSLTIIWFALLSSLIFSSADFLKRDFQDGSLEQLLISCDNFENIVLGKMVAGWLVYSLPIILFSIPLLLLSGFDQNFVLDFILSLFFASLAISFICSFCGSLSVLSGSASMIAVIAFPLIIPVVLISYKIPVNVVGAVAEMNSNITLLGGMMILSCGLSVLATTQIIKIASD